MQPSVVVPFGSWTSPLTPEYFSQGNCTTVICELEAAGNGVFWTEQSSSSGRRALFFLRNGSKTPEQLAEGYSVQSYVHEYGGGSFKPTPEGGVIFSSSEGLFEQTSPSNSPQLLISSNGNTLRFADFSVTSSHIFAVHESHTNRAADPDNLLVSMCRKTKKLAQGADFYAYPRVSPDRKKLVWMQWSHPNMAWDETSIFLAHILPDGQLENKMEIKCGKGSGVNYHCPGWSSSGQLLVVHDESGFWNVFEIELESGRYNEKNIFPVEKEIGHAVWTLADRRYASNGKQTVLCIKSQLILLENGGKKDISTPGFNNFTHLAITEDGEVYCIAAGPKKFSSLLKINLMDQSKEVIREVKAVEDWMDISEPVQLEFLSDGETVRGFLYEPKNRNFSAPEDSKPPLILLGHGGPTCCARPILDLRKQFFTSRGFAIFDVDYRGSIGYGTRFRNLLKKKNGEADRDDMINGARMLISTGRVNKDKVCIMGSSAGGFLLLNCLVTSNIFKSAVSICGVTDIAALAAITEKYERCYNEVLIGKYPEEAELYYERTPSNHLEQITAAVCFLHGREDKIVPVRQSEEMFEKLRERGIATALQIYDGEGHGFRGTAAVKRSMEDALYFLCKTLGIQHTGATSDLIIHNLDG